MAEKVIFAEQTLGFEYSEGFGAYYAGFNTSPFSLVDGQEYTVVWDGNENKRTAFAFTNPRDGTSCVALGNPLVTGGEANEDKFAIVEDKTNDNAYFFSLETNAEHTIKILQIEVEGIIIKDRSGKSNVYKGVETVTFDTDVEGVQQTFSKGSILEGAEFELDFSEGDQKANVPEGFLVKEATIKKPEALIPENIAEGIDIAGIVGAFAGGGAKIACGQYGESGTISSSIVIDHNLGVVPDIILCMQAGNSFAATSNRKYFCVGFSPNFINIYPYFKNQYYIRYGTGLTMMNRSEAITGNSAMYCSIYNANSESFALYPAINGSGTMELPLIWFAIGGLT